MSEKHTRYVRQEMFAHIGQEGQQRIAASKVLIVGCGALGAAQANLLARAGVGKLILVDRDILDWSNLQRQLLYDESQTEAGLPKVIAAQQRLQQINSAIEIDAHILDITASNIAQYVKQADLVLDATDNFETRFLLNDVCLKLGVPWIYGACVGSYGLSMNIIPHKTPCLRCLFESIPAPGTTPTCDTAGVIGPIVSMIASIQCAEALKFLVGDKAALREGVVNVDLWQNQLHQLQLTLPRPDCPACQKQEWEYLHGERRHTTTVLCGRNTVQVTPQQDEPFSLDNVAAQLAQIGPTTHNAFLVRCTLPEHVLTVFRDGRALIEGTSDPSEARSIYARYIGG
ncbi:MAG TPA: thiamine biosynthesis protein ThiF [Myxococcales bacterium]|mgnify:CR=1 FL=1|nr:thiamine biosynthesis protein ThiF [Deltaproteobacteria bacterium]HAA58101.1 thiamine biosynthesis protein ThiF [Myxococcales bacterium]|tara:strand:- start:2286 stop:3314 length:1029 start_codon:yes stop_codon:yes gene_type:complete